MNEHISNGAKLHLVVNNKLILYKQIIHKLKKILSNLHKYRINI